VFTRRLARLFSLLLIVGIAAGGWGQRKPGTMPLDLSTILTRMENATQANRLHFRNYILTREYRLYGSSVAEPPQSEVTAEVSFAPPNRKTYQINRAEGKDRGRALVQSLLNGEVAESDNHSGAVDRRNYDFTLQGEEILDGHPCWRLQLHPKRADQELISGETWVDENSYLVRRIEGDLAKSPSWWVKRVHATVTFSEIGGMWLLTATRAEADVRLIGRHILLGQAVRIQTQPQVANSSPAAVDSPLSPKRARSASPVLGAAVTNE